MKILIFLSLPAILFTGTFLEVDSSGNPDSSLRSLLHLSDEKPSSASGSGPSSSKEGKIPPWMYMVTKFSALNPKNFRKISADTPQSSRASVEEAEFAKMRKKYMKGLYEHLGQLYKELKNYHERNAAPHEIQFLESEIAKAEQRIVNYRQQLRDAYGLDIEKVRTEYSEVLNSIEELKTKLRENQTTLEEYIREVVPVSRYSDLDEEQKQNEKNLKKLKNKSRKYEKMFEYWDKPETMEQGLIPTGMRSV